jgi:hypothetical protein
MTAVLSGDDVVVIIGGGEKPHIGALAVAIPRPSLTDPDQTSSTSSVITLLGHKDDELSRPISEQMASTLQKVVVVVAGVHIDNADRNDIEVLLANSMQCAQHVISRLQSL